MKCLAVVAGVLVLTSPVALGQAPPGGGPGPGSQFGIGQLNTSGQVGSATLYVAGKATRVQLRIVGASGRSEAAGIYRGQSCVTLAAGRPAYALARISRAGLSSSVVHATAGRLRSGDYNVVVLSSTAKTARPVACGHLY